VPLASARADALGGGPAAQVAGFELGFVIAAAVAAAAAVVVRPRRGQRAAP
jgi:hypothetical protein